MSRKERSVRWGVLCAGWLALAAAVRVGPAHAAEPGQLSDADRLAGALGLDAGRLDEVRSSQETLLDGRMLRSVKALDVATGEPVGATFEGERQVDRYAEIQRAGEAWRARHGAVTPALARRLEGLAASERTSVAVWLAVDLSAVEETKDRFAPRGAEAGTARGRPSETGAGAASAVAWASPGDSEVARSARPFLDAAEERDRVEKQAEIAAADRVRRAAVRDAIAAVREAFLARAFPLDLEITYASEIVPMAVLEMRSELVDELAWWPEIDALDDASGTGGPSLAVARPTQNVTPVNDVGYDGTGIAVSVTEGERAFFANPYLTLVNCYDCGQAFAGHPTAVGGFIRSTHGTQHGLAADVSLYSANGSYGNFGVMSAAMDWGSTHARVLNNSWYWDNANSPSFWEVDRHQDYFVRTFFDTVVVAAGNFGNGCGGNFSTYVVSPAKGHNILAVGNYDDLDSLGWASDDMSFCSSFGNPLNSAGSGSQEKPEIAAVGTGMTSTTTSDPWVGGVGSGTSYASPMVAALAADVMEADPAIENDPEAVKSVLMATALHNVEGSARLSDKDGAGGIVGAAALVSAERGHWAIQFVDAGTAFPVEYSQFAYAGERMRFTIAWSANPNAAYTVDPLPADIDLCAYRADGVTLLQCSSSFNNAYEIVDFTAPASEVYRFRAILFSSDWSSGGTWLGAGWWRGEYRISPDVGYDDPHPPATGTHLVVHPTDWTPTNYWRAFGLRPKGASDYDLEMATRSLFEDPSLRVVEESSTWGGTEPDFVIVDGNHWSASAPEHYRALRWSGTDGYHIGFSNLGLGAVDSSAIVTLGPVTMAEAEVVKVVDVWVPASSHRRLRVVPTSGSADLAIYLFRSDGAVASSFVQDKAQALVSRNRTASGTATERGGVTNASAVGDWLGLVVEKREPTGVAFRVEVLPSSLFSDDFESGDTEEWSSTTS